MLLVIDEITKYLLLQLGWFLDWQEGERWRDWWLGTVKVADRHSLLRLYYVGISH
jgi:hypothetical protein